MNKFSFLPYFLGMLLMLKYILKWPHRAGNGAGAGTGAKIKVKVEPEPEPKLNNCGSATLLNCTKKVQWIHWIVPYQLVNSYF